MDKEEIQNNVNVDTPALAGCGPTPCSGFGWRLSLCSWLLIVVSLCGIVSLGIQNYQTKTNQYHRSETYRKLGELELKTLPAGQVPSELALDPLCVMEKNQEAARKAFWQSFLPY